MSRSTSVMPASGAGYAWRNGYLLVAFTALAWGINFPIMKIGLAYSPPLLYTTLRMVLGTLTMFLIARMMGILRMPHRADIPVVFSVGILQNMGFITLVTFGMQYMPAGRAAILAYTSPIWVVPTAALFLGERLTLFRALGAGRTDSCPSASVARGCAVADTLATAFVIAAIGTLGPFRGRPCYHPMGASFSGEHLLQRRHCIGPLRCSSGRCHPVFTRSDHVAEFRRGSSGWAALICRCSE